MNPFRILILDDELYAECCARKKSGESLDRTFWGGQLCGFVSELKEKYSNRVQIHVSGNAEMQDLLTDQLEEVSSKDTNSLLQSLDLLVLDIGGIGNRGPQLNADAFEQLALENFEKVEVEPPKNKAGNSDVFDYPGVVLFHQLFHQGLLPRKCLTIFLTQHDALKAHSFVDGFLEAFTQGRASAPYAIKFGKGETGFDVDSAVRNAVLDHFEFWDHGLSDAINRAEISFAAKNDLPVLIVGESGTGKESIADFIHKQWRRANAERLSDPAAGQMQVVNCGGLNEHLAKGELFGFVKGSFTGALEHRLGKVFQACGIRKLAGPKSSMRGKLKGSLSSINELTAALAKFDAADEDGKLREYNRSLGPLLHSFLTESGTEPPELIRALKTARRLIENAQGSEGNAAEYRKRLMDGSAGLLAPGSTEGLDPEWDLEFTKEEPLGTLFLDEFADLPLDVQTLLLRFLERGTSEVQPIGYPGRVCGLQVRLIVATSDSRVADFAGIENFGPDYRSKSESERPLRPDLLHRIRRGLVIRVEPVTKDNVREVLAAMIERRNPDGESTVLWADDALDFVTDEVAKITSTSGQGSDDQGRLRAFGHRRELSGLVDVVWTLCGRMSSQCVDAECATVTLRWCQPVATRCGRGWLSVFGDLLGSSLLSSRLVKLLTNLTPMRAQLRQ